MNESKPNDSHPPISSLLYKDDADGLQKVHERYYYWTEKLTSSSFDLSLAVIAANWAVFGSVDKILTNVWSKISIFTVLLSLGITLIGTKFMSEWLRKRIEFAEANRQKWMDEYKRSIGCDDPWPFTTEIDSLGLWLRRCRTWLPIMGGICFLIGLTTS